MVLCNTLSMSALFTNPLNFQKEKKNQTANSLFLKIGQNAFLILYIADCGRLI